jgi:hypothetical protein
MIAAAIAKFRFHLELCIEAQSASFPSRSTAYAPPSMQNQLASDNVADGYGRIHGPKTIGEKPWAKNHGPKTADEMGAWRRGCRVVGSVLRPRFDCGPAALG